MKIRVSYKTGNMEANFFPQYTDSSYYFITPHYQLAVFDQIMKLKKKIKRGDKYDILFTEEMRENYENFINMYYDYMTGPINKANTQLIVQ